MLFSGPVAAAARAGNFSAAPAAGILLLREFSVTRRPGGVKNNIFSYEKVGTNFWLFHLYGLIGKIVLARTAQQLVHREPEIFLAIFIISIVHNLHNAQLTVSLESCELCTLQVCAAAA